MFAIAYGLFLVVGFSVAVIYRGRRQRNERRAFGELMKIRTNTQTQLQAISEAYSDARRKLERSKREETVERALANIRTLAADVRTNITMIRAELDTVRVSEDVEEARAQMIGLADSLITHLGHVTTTETSEAVKGLINGDALPETRKELQRVNSTLKAYMKRRGIDTDRFSGLDWLISPGER